MISGEVAGATNGLTQYTDVDTSNVLVSSVAYHLHNWFNDLNVLRNNYATYAHFDREWANGSGEKLSEINREIDLVVHGGRMLGNDDADTKYFEPFELHQSEYNRPNFLCQ